MPIENRNLEPGTKLIATYKKETYHALVAASADGKVLYQLSPYDGKEYKSPSSLGTAVTSKACNGWAFWSVDTDAATEEPTVPDAPAETESTSPSEEPDDPIEETVVETTDVPLEEEPPEPLVGSFRRVPNQKGVEPGQVRLYCDSCHKSFIVLEERTRRPAQWATGPLSHSAASTHQRASSRVWELVSLCPPFAT